MLTRVRAPQFGKTPLHRAAWNGKEAAARVLLQAGADVNATDNVSEGRRGAMFGHTHCMCPWGLQLFEFQYAYGFMSDRRTS